MENLTAFGLNEISILDIIFTYIHPVHITNVRATCKLFYNRVTNIIPALYQKWVVDLPQNEIKDRTKDWKFDKLIIYSLIMSPVPESLQLPRKERLLVNALLKHYPEEECLQYAQIGTCFSYCKFTNLDEALFLAFKLGYQSIIDHLRNGILNSYFRATFNECYHNIFNAYFRGMPLKPEENIDIGETMDKLLEHPHISMDTYLDMLKICLTLQVEEHSHFISGLQAQTLNEEYESFYYSIGYFLALYVERNKLNQFLTDLKITVNIPGNKAAYQFYTNHSIDSWIGLESIPNMRGFINSLALYRPHIYAKLPQNLRSGRMTLNPYYL